MGVSIPKTMLTDRRVNTENDVNRSAFLKVCQSDEIELHYSTLPYITLHCTTLHNITLHYYITVRAGRVRHDGSKLKLPFPQIDFAQIVAMARLRG